MNYDARNHDLKMLLVFYICKSVGPFLLSLMKKTYKLSEPSNEISWHYK